MVSSALLVVFPLLMIYAAWSDLLTMKISNRVSLILIAAFFLLAPFAGLGWEDVVRHLVVAAIVFAVCFIMFAFGFIGGGDAKLASATALWFGTALTIQYVVIAGLLGGLMTLLIIKFRGTLLPDWLMAADWIRRLHDDKRGVPYGVALGASALYLYPSSVWLAAAAAL